MTTLFNHTIIAAHDKQRSASFFTEMFDLPPAEPAGGFLVVHPDDGARHSGRSLLQMLRQ